MLVQLSIENPALRQFSVKLPDLVIVADDLLKLPFVLLLVLVLVVQRHRYPCDPCRLVLDDFALSNSLLTSSLKLLINPSTSLKTALKISSCVSFWAKKVLARMG